MAVSLIAAFCGWGARYSMKKCERGRARFVWRLRQIPAVVLVCTPLLDLHRAMSPICSFP
jgi:hypothetical protein